MSAVDYLVINLEHDIDEQYQYQPGEIVRGQISLRLLRPSRIKNILLHIRGEGVAAWEDQHSGQRYQASETYINASKSVIDAGPDSPLSLSDGHHEFPFEYFLPENLPSSYIGKFGSVTYVLKATVQGEKAIDTNLTSEPFLLLRQSLLPETTKQPAEIMQQKRIYGTCSFGKVKAVVSVNKTGVVPGEDLFIAAQIANRCPKTITAVQASLVMQSTFTAKNSTNSFQQIVNRRRDEVDLGEGQGRRWQNVRLTIPPYIPETRLEFCDIIDINYLFQFRVEISGGKDLRLEIPVIVGASSLKNRKVLAMNGNGKHINSQWATVGRDMPHIDLTMLAMEAKEQDDNDNHTWHHGTLVPEMRAGGPVNNPIFGRGESFMRTTENKPVVTQREPTPDRQDYPEEIIENTRL